MNRTERNTGRSHKIEEGNKKETKPKRTEIKANPVGHEDPSYSIATHSIPI